MKDKLINYISKFVKLDEREIEVILSKISIRNYQAGDILLKEGMISQVSYFNLKGCVRLFYIVDGEEKTTAFYTELEGLTPLCVINKTLSEYY